MNSKIFLFALFLACFAGGLLIPRYLLPPATPVTKPHRGEAVEAIYATGTVEPTIMVPIAPRSAGHIAEIAAHEGDTVKKGDVLARLEGAEQQATIAELSTKLDYARKDYARKNELYKVQSASREALDNAKATMDALAAQLDKEKAQAGYLTLIAPADGLIIKKDGEIGELVSTGQPIFYLSCCAPLRITGEVDEEDIPHVKVGQKVLIQTDAFPDKVFNGTVSAITPKGDPIARSYRVRIGFNDSDIPLMIGMTTETNIITEQKSNALLIATSALSKNNQVQLVSGNKIQTKTVEIGIRDKDTVEIISGLSEQDRILATFDPELKDGKDIKPTE